MFCGVRYARDLTLNFILYNTHHISLHFLLNAILNTFVLFYFIIILIVLVQLAQLSHCQAGRLQSLWLQAITTATPIYFAVVDKKNLHNALY